MKKEEFITLPVGNGKIVDIVVQYNDNRTEATCYVFHSVGIVSKLRIYEKGKKYELLRSADVIGQNLVERISKLLFPSIWDKEITATFTLKEIGLLRAMYGATSYNDKKEMLKRDVIFDENLEDAEMLTHQENDTLYYKLVKLLNDGKRGEV